MLILTILLSIAAIALTIIVVIGFHEFGHYLMARLMGVKVLRFCLGLGKPFVRYRARNGIEYALAPIPLGGYLKMLDEREGDVEPKDRHLAFNRQALWKRTLILVMGPLFNLLLALLAFYIAFVIGVVRPLPIIDSVVPGTPAAYAGAPGQQRIVAVDGHSTPDWWSALIHIMSRIGDEGTLVLDLADRQTDKLSQANIKLDKWRLNPLHPDPLLSLGLMPQGPPYTADMRYQPQFNWLSAWQPAFHDSVLMLRLNAIVLGKLVTGKISIKSLAGPISLFRGATLALSHGIVSFMQFLAVLSIAVFMLNALPIPGLDGGHLLYLAIEKVTGKPVSVAVQVLALRLSLIVFCLLLLHVLLYDLQRLLIY